jgi:hypothetical protein
MLFVSGTENGDADHASTLVTLAGELTALCARTLLPDGRPLRLQMGLHTGEVAAGVVGTSSLRYAVFGPAVTIARGLEEASAPGVLRASEAALRRLPRGGRDRGWLPGGPVTMAGLERPVETRLMGDAARLMPLADLRAAAAAIAAGWDPASRSPPRAAADAPSLAPALDRAASRRAAAADAPLFAAALVATLLYAAGLAAAGRLTPAFRGAAGDGWRERLGLAPSPAGPGAAATVPVQAAAGAACLWAAALAAAQSPAYGTDWRDAVGASLRALAAVPRVWRAYAGLPGPGLQRAAASARVCWLGAALARAGAAAGSAAAGGATAGAAQLAVAVLMPLPPRSAACAAPLAAALAAANLAARWRGGDLATALAAYALVGVAAPLALQAAVAARSRAAVMRSLS